MKAHSMHSRRRRRHVRFFARLFLGLLIVYGCGGLLADEPTTPADGLSSDPAPAVRRLTVEQAREKAALMHDIYLATLDAMHDRYFHADRAVVPARAMEDVFRQMEATDHSQARWISASFTAMNLDHEPQTEFEQQAAQKLAKGAAAEEIIESGYYRRAGSIPLTSGCISCHSGKFGSNSPTKRFAGLVISLPVIDGASLPAESQAPSE
ncbi:MAG: DUF3365 domain-containing protein [Planctomycetaceae bacterium]